MKKNIFKTDLLNGPIFKSIVLFSIPLFVSSLFQSLYSAVDTMIVGNILGDTSLAAVGATLAIFELLIGFTNGVGVGLSIVTARCFGTGDKNILRKSVAFALIIGFSFAVFVSIVGSLSLKPLLTILNTPIEIYEEAYSYISYIVYGASLMFAYNLFSALLRAIGDSLMPFVFLLISSFINIVLDYVFLTYFKMGVDGAAIATVIAQCFSAILCFIYIYKKKNYIIPSREDFKMDKALFKDMFGQGLSLGLMSSIVCVGSVILQFGINGLGKSYIAAHNAGRRAYNIMMLPVLSVGMAAPTFVSQNAGAGNYKRIKIGLRDMYICDIVFSVFIFVLSFFYAKDLIAWITGSSDEIILNAGANYVIVSSAFFGILGILVQSRNSLQGLGAKIVPLYSSTIECLGKILFCFAFVPKFGYNAIIWCEPLIWVVMTIQLVYTLWNSPQLKNRP
ncbi:MAG: MATE family efflux transporter [Erysipelotrichaceae bacterium]|nr:MATE family efflux transporter [Erysipelotrichaceae bacterium]